MGEVERPRAGRRRRTPLLGPPGVERFVCAYYIITTVPDLDIFEFEWDDENLDKIAQRVDPEEIDSMLDERFITLRNSRSRTGDYVLVGSCGQQPLGAGGRSTQSLRRE